MKLAFWCLNLKLTSEAKEILTEVVKHNPNNKQAKAMLVSIGQAAAGLGAAAQLGGSSNPCRRNDR